MTRDIRELPQCIGSAHAILDMATLNADSADDQSRQALLTLGLTVRATLYRHTPNGVEDRCPTCSTQTPCSEAISIARDLGVPDEYVQAGNRPWKNAPTITDRHIGDHLPIPPRPNQK